MHSRCIKEKLNCGFESATEGYLLGTILAKGFEQFWNVKNLFVSVMRESKLHNIDYRAVPIYGAGPDIHTYGDLIKRVTTLDFIIRYKLGKVVSGIYGRNRFEMKDLPAEYIEHVLISEENGLIGNQSEAWDSERFTILPKAKDIIDYVFEGHILCE